MTNEVTFSLDKETFLDIIKHAAGQERTVVEFKTRETDNGRELHHAADITDHVVSLENQVSDE